MASSAKAKQVPWYGTAAGMPTDVVVEVGDKSFHLHKFPLVAKSRKLRDLITKQETNPTSTTLQNAIQEDDEREIQHLDCCHVSLIGFPARADTFVTVAKFCYGVRIQLSSSNVAPLRTAAGFLGMTEDYAQDNLVSMTEKFLSQCVLNSVNETIRTLKSCDDLTQMAETLDIPERCINFIVSKVTSDPSPFACPMRDGGNKPRISTMQIVCRRMDSSSADSWIEDLSLLSFPLFNRLISAMRSSNVSAEIIESSVMCYARRHVPGISRSSRNQPSSISPAVASEAGQQKDVLEKIIANLPIQNSTFSRSAATTHFLLGLLRAGSILNASEVSLAALERRIGSQLEQATLEDLLIPNYSHLKETLYDVDCMERILTYFLKENARSAFGETNARTRAMMLVAKLIDGYLSEVASDSNLNPGKFHELIVAIPEDARLLHDGLYSAVDLFLQAHPSITEAERETITGVIEYEKLTLEACTHAAQNDRLPLQSIVKVLFVEQLQIRHTVVGTLIPSDISHQTGSATQTPAGERGAVRNSQGLRVDMASMRTRVQELERECTNMRKVMEEKEGGSGDVGGSGGNGWRSRVARKFGCRFRTQVCDSHEPSIGEKGRRRRQQIRRLRIT